MRLMLDAFAPGQAARCAARLFRCRIQRARALLVRRPHSSLARAPPAPPFFSAAAARTPTSSSPPSSPSGRSPLDVAVQDVSSDSIASQDVEPLDKVEMAPQEVPDSIALDTVEKTRARTVPSNEKSDKERAVGKPFETGKKNAPAQGKNTRAHEQQHAHTRPSERHASKPQHSAMQNVLRPS